MFTTKTYRFVEKVILFLGYALAALVILVPILWIVSTSFKTDSDTFRIPIRLLPDRPTINSYVNMWGHRPYLRYITNSVVVSCVSTAISLMVALLAAYAFSRHRFAGDQILLVLTMGAQMVPAIVLVIPYFRIMSLLRLYDTRAGLIISYIGWGMPYMIWILKGYLDTIPRELDEAASIDGCSAFQVFSKVILPVALPGVVAAGLVSFLLAWNEFTLAYVLTSSEHNLTIGVGIAYLFGEYSVAWSELMAAGVIASVVPVILYAAASKYLIAGLTAGALK